MKLLCHTQMHVLCQSYINLKKRRLKTNELKIQLQKLDKEQQRKLKGYREKKEIKT